ncbi:hypothetical protein FF124_12120 [Martelella lutilitoris]|uniref:XdhC family protein n=1 Tax=Martelella lutilitoris TaxID=2583532 RepID=A0A5C4JQD1_9HYPH|nr:XdhC family protein [Martelella lutilitoris]TNB47593.1 hypothetical protein FF124_12120 [Martelella lutilitoris]
MNDMLSNHRSATTLASTLTSVQVSETDFPLDAALDREGCSIAVITAVEGASDRPLGAAMVIGADGQTAGTLSSGCIERDVVTRARNAARTDRPKKLRYGKGSPFLDLQLPCGDGLEITLIPNPSQTVLKRASAALRDRRNAGIAIGEDGRLTDMLKDGDLMIQVVPRLRVLVFGKGPEPKIFARLARAAGQSVELHSPDAQTREGIDYARPMTAPEWPEDVALDHRTAVVLFFLDHDWELPLIWHALSSPAFYVGAQGSAGAHEKRIAALEAIGVRRSAIDRMARPFDPVTHAGDPHSLASGVLAQILDHARLT